MANGDAAAAKGMTVVAGTDPRKMGYDEINKSRDYIAKEIDDRTTADGKKVDKPTDGSTFARVEPGSSHVVGFYTLSDSTLYFRPNASTAQYDRKVMTSKEFPGSGRDFAELQDLVTELLARVEALENGTP